MYVCHYENYIFKDTLYFGLYSDLNIKFSGSYFERASASKEAICYSVNMLKFRATKLKHTDVRLMLLL